MPNKLVNLLLDNLYKKPKLDKGLNRPRFQPRPANLIHQADLLYLPNDDGYKYALVVVDVGTRKTDAEPIKSHSASDVVAAFKKIYKRKILKLPKEWRLMTGQSSRA